MAGRGWAVAALLGALATHAEAAGNPLLAERGRTRPLVFVSPAPGEAADAFADATARDRAALAERQVVVFTVIANAAARNGMTLGPAAGPALRAAMGLDLDGPPVTLLIGKDGGVKLRASRLAIADILAAIDAMPMRRQEMRQP